MTADEKKILLLYDWERDMPVHCQRCDGNRYIGAILYANLEAKREIDKLRAELEKAHKFIDAKRSLAHSAKFPVVDYRISDLDFVLINHFGFHVPPSYWCATNISGCWGGCNQY